MYILKFIILKFGYTKYYMYICVNKNNMKKLIYIFLILPFLCLSQNDNILVKSNSIIFQDSIDLDSHIIPTNYDTTGFYDKYYIIDGSGLYFKSKKDYLKHTTQDDVLVELEETFINRGYLVLKQKNTKHHLFPNKNSVYCGLDMDFNQNRFGFGSLIIGLHCDKKYGYHIKIGVGELDNSRHISSMIFSFGVIRNTFINHIDLYLETGSYMNSKPGLKPETDITTFDLSLNGGFIINNKNNHIKIGINCNNYHQNRNILNLSMGLIF